MPTIESLPGGGVVESKPSFRASETSPLSIAAARDVSPASDLSSSASGIVSKSEYDLFPLGIASSPVRVCGRVSVTSSGSALEPRLDVAGVSVSLFTCSVILSLFDGRHRVGCSRFAISRDPSNSSAFVIGMVSVTSDQVPNPSSSCASRCKCKAALVVHSRCAYCCL